MKLTRRTIIAGAMGIPAIAAARWYYTVPPSGPAGALVSDAPAGRAFARALGKAGLVARELSDIDQAEARELVAQRLPVFAGVTGDDDDAGAFANAAMEAGYATALVLRGNCAGCSGFADDAEWNPVVRRIVSEGSNWLGAFAGYMADPEGTSSLEARVDDPAFVSAWLMVRRS